MSHASAIPTPERPLIRDAKRGDFVHIRDFLLESSDLYPDIDRWWETKVQPNAAAGRRPVLIVEVGRRIEGLFIGKPGISAKLCTLRLREGVRNQGVGRALVTEGLGRLMEPDTTHVHVTISEAAEEGCLAFFESIGFRRKAVEPNRYRRGVDEFIYSCPAGELAGVLRDNLSRGVERTLFGTMPKTLPQENTLLMSLRPEFAELMLRHRKTVEFRRKFSTKHVGARVIFYVTHPVRQFLFMATIANVDHRPKKQLWTTHRAEGGVSKELFDHYFSGMENGYAIRLDNLQPIPNQLYLRDAQRVCPALRPPQSFQALEPQSPLLRALDLPVNV